MKVSDNVWRMVEGEDFYHEAKTVGGLEKVSSPTITKPRRCRLPFFRSERTRRHLRDIVRVECSSVRRQVWVDPVAYAGTRGMEVDQKLSVHNKSTELGSGWRCFLSSYRNRSAMHCPTTRLVRIQLLEQLPTPFGIGLASPSQGVVKFC